jgi:hypothetical protein
MSFVFLFVMNFSDPFPREKEEYRGFRLRSELLVALQRPMKTLYLFCHRMIKQRAIFKFTCICVITFKYNISL